MGIQEYTGKVKFFNKHKGYGFIRRSADNEEIFVHFASIDMNGFRKLEKGDKVSFKTEIHPRYKKEQAINVTKQK